MYRRLTALAHRVRHFLRSIAYLIQRIPGTVRHWAVEWFDVLALPFRVLSRPREIGTEIVKTGRDALSLGGGAVHGAISSVVGFLWLMIWSPLIVTRFLLYDLPYRIRYYTHWNAPKRVLIAVVAVVGLVVGLGTWAVYTMTERRASFQRDVYWRMFFYYVDHAEIDKVEDALVKLQGLLPDNGTITARLNMVQAREAPISDPLMVRLIMRTHYREQRYDLAAKEAAKLAEINPNDWEALCFLTNEALTKGDMEAVRRHISAMPRARDVPDQVYLWTIPYALNLFKRLGDFARYNETIDYTAVNFLPRLLAKDLETEHPFVTILLFECYDHAMSQVERRPQLTRYWDSLQRASRTVLHAKGMTASELARLGVSVEQQLIYLQKFAALKYITADDRKAMAVEVEQRLTEIWNAVLQLDPKNDKAFVGLGHIRLRAGEPMAAVEIADRGIAQCGETRWLVAARARYLCAADPQAGRRYVEWVLQKKVDLTPELCLVWYEVERAAGRRDMMKEACEKAIKLEPGLYWAHLGLGAINIELEKWTDAAAALEPIRTQVVQSPFACRLYVKALCECGAYGIVDQMLSEMKAEQRSLDVLVEAARGLQLAARYEDAIRWARQALDRDEFNTGAMNIMADSLAKLAENGETGWHRDTAHEAIKYYRRVQQQRPKDLVLANNIAWLEVKALGLPNDAEQSAAPLREVQDTSAFPPGFLETLGVIEVERGRCDEGRKYLERAAASGEKASYFYHLALAYHGLDLQDRAKEALFQASRLPKSPREHAEYLEVAKRIEKGR
jgi:tetratricopeptide (TPR) repeat protein